MRDPRNEREAHSVLSASTHRLHWEPPRARLERRISRFFGLLALMVLFALIGALMAACGGGGDATATSGPDATVLPVSCGRPGACG